MLFYNVLLSDEVAHDGEASDRFFKFDNTRYEWEELPHMTVRRHTFALAHHDGYIYAVGGKNMDGWLDNVERFDMKCQSWECVCTLPDPMLYPSIVTLAGQLIIYGLTTGNREISLDERHETDSLVALDPKTQRVSLLFKEVLVNCVMRESLTNFILVQNGILYRVWFKQIHDDDAFAHVNQIEIRHMRNGFTRATIGRAVDGQDAIQRHNENAFHINGHVYVGVNGSPRKMGMVGTVEQELERARWSLRIFGGMRAVGLTIDTKKAF